MANLDWGTVNRCAAYGLTGGLGNVAGSNNYTTLIAQDGPGNISGNVAASREAVRLQQGGFAQLQSKFDMLVDQIMSVYQQGQQYLSQAQELAAESTSSQTLTLLDRMSAVATQLDDLAARAEAAQARGPRMPSTVRLEVYSPQGRAHTPEEGNARREWLKAAAEVENVTAEVRPLQQQAVRTAAQLQQVYKQIESIVARERQAQAAIDAREAQQQALENARLAQQQQLEQARMQQQWAIEQAKAQAELQLQQAQLQQQYSMLQPSSYALPGASAVTPVGVPQGYSYDPATGYYYNPQTGYYYNAADGQYYVDQSRQGAQTGVQYQAAAVQYAQQPASWGYTSPSQWIQPQGYQTPQGQTGRELTDPNWTNIEYQDLIAGEAQYLFRGLRGLGASEGMIRAASIDPALVAKAKAAGLAAGAGAPAATKGGGGVTTADVASIIDAIGQATTKALPAFFPGMQQEQPPPELPPRSSGMGDALKVGAVVVGGGAALYGLSQLLGGGSKTKGRRR